MSINILIVDDSRIFRRAVEEGLARETGIKVVGSVWNGIKAIEFIEATPPDIVTLDVQMPDMDGLQTLEAIQQINASRPSDRQIGVIMLSSHTKKGADITVQALQMGAFDFIPKPESRNLKENILNLCRQLTVKIRNYASVHELPPGRQRDKLKKAKPQPVRGEAARSQSIAAGIRAILIGVSTGGPKALAEILPPLCAGIDVPIFIVQHMPPTFTESLAKSLNSKCRYTVRECTSGDFARNRHAYIAPGGRHMLLSSEQRKIKTIIQDLPPEKGCRPSVDLLFRSAAQLFGNHVIGVILTGMGSDGTEGARTLKELGGYIIAQDEESSVVWGMPGSAKAAGIVDEVLPLREIPEAIIAMLQKQG